MEPGAIPTLLHATRAHRGELACLDLSATRPARLATGGGCGALAVWRWRSSAGWEREAEAPHAHRYGVTAARWAGGGALLASGGVDGALRVWAARGAELHGARELAAPGATAVRALAWLGAGRGARLVVGHDDGAVRVWEMRRGRQMARLTAQPGALHALAVLADGALLLTGCTEGSLRVYDLPELCSRDADEDEEDEEVTPLMWIDHAHDLGVLCAVAAPRPSRVATGGQDECVRLWELGGRGHEGGHEGGRGRGEGLLAAGVLRGHAAAVTALCWGTRDVLASASLDRTARLWAAAHGTCLHVVQAHSRYLTCVALSPDLRRLVTGSNDRSFRTWWLGALSPDAEPQAPCDARAHFALGDLEGIGPVEFDEDAPESERVPEVAREVAEKGEEEGEEEEDGGGGGTCCVWRTQAHGGAINCIAAHGEFLATASSDGTVKVWRWTEGAGAVPALRLEHELAAHRYPALACHFGAAGAVLLSAGLDGAALLWDVQSGVQVRALRVPGGGGTGGGGVRDARLSPGAAPRALLATDDGLAPLWSAADPDPQPARVYAGLSSAAACCAWSHDGRLAAVGGAGGELLLLAPPRERELHRDAHAHDLGVTSCDFPPRSAPEAPESGYLLATAGNDSLIKLWTIELLETSAGAGARVQLARSVSAQGGGAAHVRWSAAPGGPALLASAGHDSWARLWRVWRAGGAGGAGGALRVRGCGAVAGAEAGAGGALAALWTRALLAVGALRGELALWRLPLEEEERADDDTAPRFWREAAVARWLRERVTRVPGSRMSRAGEAALLRRARDARLGGARLLDAPVEEVLASLGLVEEEEEEEEEDGEDATERAAARSRLEDELAWLREDPPDLDSTLGPVPHALLCPLSHRLLRWPASAADGFTYERDNMLEWLLAAPPEGCVSPVSGRRLRSTRLTPNYKLMQTLRAFVRQQAPARENSQSAVEELLSI